MEEEGPAFPAAPASHEPRTPMCVLPWSGSGRYVITEVLVNAAQEKKEKTSIICGRRYRLPGST